MSAQIQQDCERRFQNGAGRVQTIDPEGNLYSDREGGSAWALRIAPPGFSVWARRKARGQRRYEWVCVGVAQ